MELNELLDLLKSKGVRRALFDGDALSEVEFFDSLPAARASETETIALGLPEDDGVPMGVTNAVNVLLQKKPAKGAA